MIRAIIGFFGFFILYPKLKSFILFLFNLIYGPKRNLISIYGKNSYVLITGGSEGIGESIAQEFASRGFNLILIARSVDKLKKAEAEVLKKFPSCKVIIVSFDFNKIDNPQYFDLSKAFGLDFNSIDVSVVVNNVGIGRNGLFYDSNEEDIKQMIRVNCVPQVLMTRYFIPIFNKRNNRSAFLNTSSLSAVKNFPFYDTYGASKKFNYQFSESIGDFYPNIDVYTFMPSFVTTRLTNFKTEGMFVIYPDECAKATIDNFGSYRYIFNGHWKHEIYAALIDLIPEKLLVWFMMSNKKKFIKKRENE